MDLLPEELVKEDYVELDKNSWVMCKFYKTKIGEKWFEVIVNKNNNHTLMATEIDR